MYAWHSCWCWEYAAEEAHGGFHSAGGETRGQVISGPCDVYIMPVCLTYCENTARSKAEHGEKAWSVLHSRRSEEKAAVAEVTCMDKLTSQSPHWSFNPGIPDPAAWPHCHSGTELWVKKGLLPYYDSKSPRPGCLWKIIHFLLQAQQDGFGQHGALPRSLTIICLYIAQWILMSSNIFLAGAVYFLLLVTWRLKVQTDQTG